jgi:hypothetical protein
LHAKTHCSSCSFIAAGEGGGADWRCDWTVRPQTYLLEDEGPVQGCHMLVPGSSICTACRRFSGDLRYCMLQKCGGFPSNQCSYMIAAAD